MFHSFDDALLERLVPTRNEFDSAGNSLRCNPPDAFGGLDAICARPGLAFVDAGGCGRSMCAIWSLRPVEPLHACGRFSPFKCKKVWHRQRATRRQRAISNYGVTRTTSMKRTSSLARRSRQSYEKNASCSAHDHNWFRNQLIVTEVNDQLRQLP